MKKLPFDKRQTVEPSGDYPPTFSTARLQTRLIILVASGILATGLIVVTVSVFLFYGQLKKEQEQRLLGTLMGTTSAVQEYFARIAETAVQITSRTRARNKLEDYNQGNVSLAEFKAFSAPILTDAMAINPSILGITRLDAANRIVLEVGAPIPQNEWPALEQVTQKPTTRGPFPLAKGYGISVAAPILDRQWQRVGTDIVLFDAQRLQTLLSESLNPETQALEQRLLGKLEADGAALFFQSYDQPSPVKAALDTPLALAIERAAQGQRGILPAAGRLGTVIAYGPIQGTPWSLMVSTPKDRFYAPIQPQILKLTAVLILLVFLSSGSAAFLLKPLSGRLMIRAQDLEREVAERQRAIEETLGLKERLDQVIQASPAVIYAIDCTGDAQSPFQLTLTSKTVETLFGYPLSEWFSDHDFWVKHLHPDDRSEALGQLKRLFEQGILDFEYRFRHQNGLYRWINDRARLLRDEKGCPKEIIGSWLDITERKKAEAAQKASERKVRAIIDHVQDGVIAFDEKGILETFNPAAEKIFGYLTDEVIGQTIAHLMPPDHQAGMAHFLELGSADASNVQELIGLKKDGTPFPISLSVSEMLQDHWPLEERRARKRRTFIGTIQDLTERKQTEEMLRRSQKMEALAHLTSGIAHDFNNLLGIISGNLEMLQRMVGEGEDIQRRISTALKSTWRGTDLIRRLHRFAHHEPTPAKPIALGELFDGMKDLLKKSLTQQIEIEFHVAQDLWKVEIDGGEFEDALLNLALNAKDAMPEGGKLVIEAINTQLENDYARRHPGLEAGDYVLVAVSDNGIGMPQEVIEKALDPFFTTKPPGKGTGLGLSMVYGFIKRAKGHIKLYSELGHGTTVRLYLPKSSSTLDEPVPAMDNANPLPCGNETILIVDDEPDLIQVAQTHLEESGYQTLTAQNGQEALDLLAHNQAVNLLFSDVIMPGGLSGYEVAEKALALRPELKVLLTTGYTQKNMGRHSLTRFATPLLSKPYTRAELLRQIRETLDRQN